MSSITSKRFKMLGMLLFLLGLITGFAMPGFKNPRMGLSAHLEGILNGIFLVIAGIIWDELQVSNSIRRLTFVTLIYGTYMNWLTSTCAGFFGTSNMTPIAGQDFHGTNLQEIIITAGFVSVGLTMLISLVIIVYGLRKIKN